MPLLNLPKSALKIKTAEGTTQVFDVVRNKFVILTQEEWVRQHFVHYLHSNKKYPFGLMGVEKKIQYNTLKTRADIILYNTNGKPIMIVECKAPDVIITQDTFFQLLRYNYSLSVKYLIMTNGLQHICCQMDYTNHNIIYLDDIPPFET